MAKQSQKLKDNNTEIYLQIIVSCINLQLAI